MVTYKYRAQDENGKAISGTMQATDELDLHERLKQEKKNLIDMLKLLMVINQKIK